MKQLSYSKAHYHLHNDMIRWARENIGPGGWRVPSKELWGDTWGIVINFGNQDWYFIRDEDATVFALRWP